LVRTELEFQTSILERLVRDLNQRIDRASSVAGHITVVDTHVLLHYEPPWQVIWPEVVGRSPVRLVVPLRVVEELDAKKYARRDELAGAARILLTSLEEAVAASSGPNAIREDVTIEVPIEPGFRRRPEDADREILDSCLELKQFGGHEVTLVTGDTAMLLRAQSESIQTMKMPEKYERQRSAPTKPRTTA
jgi:predicted ribonuclease YlaK